MGATRSSRRTSKYSSSEDAVVLEKSPLQHVVMTHLSSAGSNGSAYLHPSRTSHQRNHIFGRLQWWSIAVIVLAIIPAYTEAAFVRFQNCLSQSVQKNKPLALQFVPLFVDAKFNTVDPRHNLNITVYGNVTGQSNDNRPYPPPSDPIWSNTSSSFGKITNVTINYTTLFTEYQVVSYTPYDAPRSEFCQSVLGDGCPLGPLFDKNASDPTELHRFSVAHDFGSAFQFATFDTTLRVQSGDVGGAFLACIKAGVTPDLGSGVSGAIRWVPMVILGLVGFATILAAKFHPSSSRNFFYWSSNYGRDEDMLRLVTPGFGDCLQYIQFAVLTGSLTLNYPGYFQPVLSKASWSTLTFNESFVSKGPGFQSLTDGVYLTNGTYGFSDLAQLVGMSTDQDIWAGMAVWLAVIVGVSILISQLGFAINWAYMHYKRTPREDLQNKNLPFTAGNLTRIIYNFFLLPVVALSIFQLVIAGSSPAWETALAAILLLAIVIFAIWSFFLIFTTKPRVYLFDHLPSLLLYGPLYNTYSDKAAPFAVIPIICNFMRGIAIGAVQPSGIAQIVILAICEIVFLLTLHAFRPFQKATSMNAYHTVFSSVRLITIFLCIAFVPFLNVDEGSKGWIGYVLLFLHACVLIFGFFLNAVQTLIEVFARMAGVEKGGIARVLGVRQLSKREERRHDSLGSSAAMLEGSLKAPNSHRLTSLSGTSHGKRSSYDRLSHNLDNFSQGEATSIRSVYSPGPSTPGGGPGGFTLLPGGGIDGSSGHARTPSGTLLPPAPYYRVPRQRRTTLETTSELRSLELQDMDPNGTDGSMPNSPKIAQRHSLISSSFRDENDPRIRQSDYYAHRESDFNYGVTRGSALSGSISNRRRITGPADPMSPVANATGWFKGMFNRRKKDSSKGFEVVRSRPLHLLREQDEDDHAVSSKTHAPYTDASGAGAVTEGEKVVDHSESDWEIVHGGEHASGAISKTQSPQMNAPELRPISTIGSIEFPSHLESSHLEADTAYHPPSQSLSRVVSPEDVVERTPYIGADDRPISPLNEDRLSRRRSQGNSVASSVYPASINETNQTSQQVNHGQVHQRLAAEGLRRYTLQASHMGSAAELVDEAGNAPDQGTFEVTRPIGNLL